MPNEEYRHTFQIIIKQKIYPNGLILNQKARLNGYEKTVRTLFDRF